MSRLRRSGGFTLIEITVVLAIAGLMMVLVFLALEQGNRNKRDDAREADAARYLSAAKQWLANNSGVLPANQADAQAIASQYITAGGAAFVAPDGTPWNILWGTGTPASADDMLVSSAASCGGAGGGSQDESVNHSRQIAVVVQLESGGNYCVSN